MKYEFINVNKIFERYKIINVPYYQRDYVWGEKNDGMNLYKFIDDIFNQYNNNASTEYFIGTLAFCSEKVNDVIDGQQRLTSLVLILSILSNLKCSEEIKEKNKKLIQPNGKFVIQEDFYLTEELKYSLGIDNNFNTQGYKKDISKTVEKIQNQINRAWGDYETRWYDGLYNYILDKVMLISIEYGNIGESVKYFLNINSLSVQLTQSDIFFSILSQAIRISESDYSIFTIKQKVAELGKNNGIHKEDIDGYKLYDTKDNGIDNVIYVFLNAYYKDDKNIMDLNKTGIGKWMSFYKNEVFNSPIKAQEFTNKFVSFLKDFEFIYKQFSNMNTNIKINSSLYLSWILLQYGRYEDILKVLLRIFKYRHNYIDKNLNLYKQGTTEICFNKLNEIAKRLNLTLIWNYIRNSNKRLDGFIDNISVDTQDNYKNTIEDIIGNIDTDSIFNLTYRENPVSKIRANDDARIIKVIMGIQEAYLNFVANPTKDFNQYLASVLISGKFSIEHLYSIEEFYNNNRRNNWITKKNKFEIDTDFDAERFKFENLSLLNSSSNSSAGTDEIYDKLTKYKSARKVCDNEWEYLIQSLAEDSEYYKSSKIQELNLPKRTITNIDQNTWDMSENNREFNTKLLKMAIKEVANK